MNINLAQLPALVKRQIPTAQLPAIYQETKRQLARCVDLLVVKDYHDKAMGLAEWARIAKEPEMEEHALRIRLHARLRVGQLLNEIKPTGRKGVSGLVLGSGAKGAAKAIGMTKTECTVSKRLASAPAALIAKLEADPPRGALDGQWARTTLPPKDSDWARGVSARCRNSDAYRTLVSGTGGGIHTIISHVRNTDPRLARNVSIEEAEKLRPVLLAITEWCDEIEQNLPKQKESFHE
jgi:hypothetical protein